MVWALYLALCDGNEREAGRAIERAYAAGRGLPLRDFWLCCAHARELAEHDGFRVDARRAPR